MAGFGLDPVPGLIRLVPDSAYLFLLNGPKAQKRFSLQQMRMVIGRGDPPNITVDLDLTDCELDAIPMISRRHAIIQWVNGELQILDLASRNGTYVDGQRLNPTVDQQLSSPAVLKRDSKVKLANLEFEVITCG